MTRLILKKIALVGFSIYSGSLYAFLVLVRHGAARMEIGMAREGGVRGGRGSPRPSGYVHSTS